MIQVRRGISPDGIVLYRHGEKMSTSDRSINRLPAPVMRSIRHQIALPILAIQFFFAFMTALTGAYVASSRVESEITGRLEGLSNVLTSPQFPLTQSVLQRLHQLTGAHFISTDEHDRPLHSSLLQVPARLPQSKWGAGRLGDAPRVRYQDTDFFSIAISVNGQNPRLIALYPVELWQSSRREALFLPLLLGSAGLLAMSVVTNLVARRISTRLSSVETGVARISSGTFEELAINPQKNDEIEQLASSINHMSRQIQEMQTAIENTGRMRLLAQIGSALAHQLRNSITGARMAIQLHFRRCPVAHSDASIAMALKQLQLTEEQIRGLITQNQAMREPAQTVDLTRLVQETLTLLELQANHTRVKLQFEEPVNPCQVQGCLEDYRTAIFNLINNAIDAARDGGSVRIVLNRLETGALRLQIIDDGPGFSQNVIGHIGQPFVSSKPEGLGLGLFLATQVADRHQSRLEWERVNDHTIFQWLWPASTAQHHSDSEESKNLGQTSGG